MAGAFVCAEVKKRRDGEVGCLHGSVDADVADVVVVVVVVVPKAGSLHSGVWKAVMSM